MALGVKKTGHLALVAALFGLLAFFIAAGPAADRASAQGACSKFGDKESDEITREQARKAILCLLNRERNQRGLKGLDTSSKLQATAQGHNAYMQKKSCFSHQCPGEASLTGRLEKVNWLTGGLNAWAYGENIAHGSGRFGTPENIVKQWMNSSGHRANILSNRFDEIGIGYSDGTVYSPNSVGSTVTTDFGWKIG